MLRSSLAAGVSAAAILIAVPAFAADMPAPDYSAPPAPAPVVAPVVYDWTGVYMGVSAGYGWGDRTFGVDEDDFDDAFDFEDDFEADADGFLAGAQIGANWQVNQWVFGVEGDISWANIEGEDEVFFDDPFEIDQDMEATASYEMNWLATVRGRVGVAFDRFLVYGTGGVAFADVDTGFNGAFDFEEDGAFDDAPFNNEDGGTHTGWTLGAGVEAALTDNLSLKAEYLYVDLGDEDYTYTVGGDEFTAESDLDAHVVRAGLNYRFNMF